MTMRSMVRTLMIAALALGASHCKTPTAASGVKDLDTGGMNVQTGPATYTTWAQRMGLTLNDGEGGVSIAKLQPAHFGAVIGLLPGDQVQALNGQSVASAADFETVATGYASGSAGDWDGQWVFQVSRGGQALSVQAASGYDCNPYVLAECGPLPN